MERNYEIRKVPIWPVAKITFIVLLVIGILIAIIYSIIFSGLSFLANTFSDSPFCGEFGCFRSLGFVMIPVIALTYAIFGTIGMVIWVLIYNLIAAVVGGFELTLIARDQIALRPTQPEPGSGKSAHIPERPINGF